MLINLSLSWQDNSDNEDGFRLERSVDGGPFSQIAQVGPNVVGYQDQFDNTGAGGHVLTYRVAAFNSAGMSNYSNEAQITTPVVVTVPAAPSTLIVQLV